MKLSLATHADSVPTSLAPGDPDPSVVEELQRWQYNSEEIPAAVAFRIA